MEKIAEAGNAILDASEALDEAGIPADWRETIEVKACGVAGAAGALVRSAAGIDLPDAAALQVRVAELEHQLAARDQKIAALSQDNGELIELAEAKKRELYCSGCGEEKTCAKCGSDDSSNY
jgi:hypothetical protein